MSTQFSASPSTTTKRQPRGSINRRACQKCRHLKIKCDGDAENNVFCSNCDPGTCVYDKSPRKNRQVEKLNAKVENLENTLMETQGNLELIRNDFNKRTEELNSQVEALKLEKQNLNLLFDCHHLFADHLIVFSQLRQVISESRCWPVSLHVINALLVHLSQGTNTTQIIAMLKSIVDGTINFCSPNDAFNPSESLPNLIEEIAVQANIPYNTTINNSINNSTEDISDISTTRMANLALHSPGSDASNLSIKIDLASPHLTPNIDMHLTPDDVSYYSQSGSEYASSPIQPTDNDFAPYQTTTYLEDYSLHPFVYGSSYGSNSSNH